MNLNLKKKGYEILRNLVPRQSYLQGKIDYHLNKTKIQIENKNDSKTITKRRN